MPGLARRPRPDRLRHPPPALATSTPTPQERLRRRDPRALRRRGGRRGATSTRPAATGTGVFGYIDAHLRQAFRLRLKDPAAIDAALADRSEAYRRLDAAILEELILKRALGMTRRGHRRQARPRLRERARGGAAACSTPGAYQAAFLLRPTPVEQVREVAAAGETMPPKSTYFFPKVLTGMVFNPAELEGVP